MRQWRRPRREAAGTIFSQQAEEVMPCCLFQTSSFHFGTAASVVASDLPVLDNTPLPQRSLSTDSGRSNRVCGIWERDASVDQAESPGSKQPTAPPRVPTEAQTERGQLTQLFQLVHTCLVKGSLSHHRAQDLNFSLCFCLFHQLPSSHFQSSSSDSALVGFKFKMLEFSTDH